MAPLHIPITAALAGYSSVLLGIFSMRVSVKRFFTWTLYGYGKPEIAQDMEKKVRAHANATEYIPLYIILSGIMEAGEYVGQNQLVGLAAAFAVARTIHSAQLAGDPLPLWFRSIGIATQQLLYLGVGGLVMLRGLKKLKK